ncbi:hypothetical protein K3J40_002369 [Escherichia coli]|nr:hypothetical protein [Escherichia coli]
MNEIMKQAASIEKIIAAINATRGYRKHCNGLSGTLRDDGYVHSICEYVRVTSPDRIEALIEHITLLNIRNKALEQKCAALAAENMGLIRSSEILLHEASEVYRAYNKTQLPDGDLVDEQSLQEVYDAINATPTTDAFLADARAQGVEMFAECAYTLEHHDHAVAFAAELRKGGNQ